jgi:hypothetical protein
MDDDDLLDSILDEAMLDSILDEELEKLDLASDPQDAADMSHFFSTSKDCSCCKGFMNSCDCVSASSAEHCTKCTTGEVSVDALVAESTEYDTTSEQGRFARAVQASAEAVSTQAAPGLSRNPSVTSNENVFNFSVKIFPPPSSVLQRDMFKMMFVPAIVASLGNGPNGENLTWPDRGWRTQAEFDMELGAALQKRTCHIEGIVVARNQTEDEAAKLAEAMSALEVSSAILITRAFVFHISIHSLSIYFYRICRHHINAFNRYGLVLLTAEPPPWFPAACLHQHELHHSQPFPSPATPR